jgi:hypothetical protein
VLTVVPLELLLLLLPRSLVLNHRCQKQHLPPRYLHDLLRPCHFLLLLLLLPYLRERESVVQDQTQKQQQKQLAQ